MLPVNCSSHADYQNFVTDNLRKYYPNPDALAPSTWDIIERFWSLDLSYTDELMRDKYSKSGPAPRSPSCMQRSYLLSIDFKVTPINPLGCPALRSILYMPFLVGLKSEIHLVPVLFMTSLTGYGILKRTICLLISIL